MSDRLLATLIGWVISLNSLWIVQLGETYLDPPPFMDWRGRFSEMFTATVAIWMTFLCGWYIEQARKSRGRS